MNADATALHRLERSSALAGAIALVAALPLAWFWRQAAGPAWECAALVALGIALGSLLFVLIQQVTGGAWGRRLRPFLLGGTRLLPWVCLLWVPLLALHWSGQSAAVIRTLVYGGVIAAIAVVAVRAWPGEGPLARLAWIGPVGLIAVLFLTHIFVGDWIAVLDPRWVSTAFPVVWLIGQGVAGFALAVLMAMLGGADPREPVAEGRPLGIDWGTLLFAAAMLWCYVAFAQFLIVWSGNLPKETGWYARRIEAGWRWVPVVLLALHFVLPLGVLLSRAAKQRRAFLVGISAALIFAQLLHTAWLILPAAPGDTARALGLAALLIVAFGGLFANRYLAFARRERSAS